MSTPSLTAMPPRRRRRPNWAALALGAYVVAFLGFIVAPIAAVVLVSFSSASFITFPIPGYTLRWYWRIIEYRPFLDAMLVSIEVALASTVLAAALGVPAALALARSRGVPAALVSNFLLAPITVPAIVLGLALLYFLASLSFGLSFTALLIAHTVAGIPYVTRTVLAVYRSLPPDLEEASAVLGATRWQTFRYTTLPLVRPGVFAGGLFAVLTSLDNLPLSFFFGSASTSTLPVVMLSYMENQFDPSIAAVSTVQMLVAIVALVVTDRVYGIEKLTAA
ncbi:ABC transporter permease [Methylobacterium oryzihabitans]|jgi:putative spermidine/putrescine transport system permease protein|nr:ABC transporter permease [Methylobacterium oryzihabitans]